MNLHAKDEPALVVALVQATIAVVVSFGMELTTEQVGAILALTATASALFLRGRVKPVSTEPDANETPAIDG